MSSIRALVHVSFKHILISLTGFIDAPNSVTICTHNGSKRDEYRTCMSSWHNKQLLHSCNASTHELHYQKMLLAWISTLKWTHKQKLCWYIVPRVEAGKNTSTVIPASRKRRRKKSRISLRWDSASRPKRSLIRTYIWIRLFTSYIKLQQISL
jgi:hypothetical protein